MARLKNTTSAHLAQAVNKRDGYIWYDHDDMTKVNKIRLGDLFDETLYDAVPWWNTAWSRRALVPLDNTTGAGAVAAGTPVMTRIPSLTANFDWSRIHESGYDLRATDVDGNRLKLWREAFVYSNRYAVVHIEAPAGGVGAGLSVPAYVYYGNDEAADVNQAAYDVLFRKRIVDANTVALFPFDEGTGTSAVSVGGGHTMTLNGSPAWGDTDGGNYRLRTPVMTFSDGSFLSFDGTDDYGNVPGLLDTWPAEGCINFWVRFRAQASGGRRIFSKINSTSPTVEALILAVNTDAGQPHFHFTHYKSSVVTNVVAPLSNTTFPEYGRWYMLTLTWDADGFDLWLNAVRWQHYNTDGPPNAGSEAGFQLGAEGGSLFCNADFDELEVRNAKPTPADMAKWFRRNGPQLGAEITQGWTKHADSPVLVPTLANEGSGEAGGGSVLEPTVLPPWVTGRSDWLMFYTAGLHAGAYYVTRRATSADGVTWTKDADPVMGATFGGKSGGAVSNNVYYEAGTYYMYFSESYAPGSPWYYATSTDGNTFTYQGVLKATDAAHTGYYNSYILKDGGTYHLLLDYHDETTTYHTHYLTATSPTGPFTVQAEKIGYDKVPAVRGGRIPLGGSWIYKAADGKFHLWYAATTDQGILPTAIVHSVSDDMVRWMPFAGDDVVIQLDHFDVYNLQDQECDPYLVPRLDGKVWLYGECGMNTPNVGFKIVLWEFDGTMADLTVESPAGVPGGILKAPGT